MDKYKLTVGLEVHAELSTETKMFCACKNDGNEKRPNWNICPICMGHPGTLPVPNREAIKNVLKVGVAIGGELSSKTEFDRKNYFYPDIPKGYQISQFKYPFVVGGELAGIKITRVHLEEDTARSSHENGVSLVDFNRAGVPLMELVTEPVIHSGEEVVRFGRELQLLLQYLGVSEANMEKGEMRVEANISVSDSDKLGTKVEVKNLNSFRAANDAVNFEYRRHVEILENGGKISQETRGWDENSKSTFSQRSKEDSHDYRYFPDPDLAKIDLELIPEFNRDVLKKELALTPEAKRARFAQDYNIKKEDIEFFILNRDLSNLFERAAEGLEGGQFQLLSNYVVSDLASFGDAALSLNPMHLAQLINMIDHDQVSSRGAKNILNIMLNSPDAPDLIAEREGLFQKNDTGALMEIIEQIIKDNPLVVTEYKNGKVSALQYLVGQGMKLSKGSANPGVLKSMLEKAIS